MTRELHDDDDALLEALGDVLLDDRTATTDDTAAHRADLTDAQVAAATERFRARLTRARSTPEPEGVGRVVGDHRRALGLGLDTYAAQFKLTPSQLAAIEGSDDVYEEGNLNGLAKRLSAGGGRVFAILRLLKEAEAARAEGAGPARMAARKKPGDE